MKQQRIAMLSLHSCPLGKLGGKDTGGMNVYIRELTRELDKRGHIVDIFTNAHNSEHESIVNLGNNTRLIHLQTGNHQEMPKIALYSYLEKFAVETNAFSSKHNSQYDFIHSHYWLSGLLGNKLQKSWHIPQIVMFHTLGEIKNRIGVGSREPSLRIEGEKQVIHTTDRIIAATEREKASLIKYYGASEKSISTIPCGVNLDLFKPMDQGFARKELGIVQQHKIILFVGRVEPLKGLENLLLAFSLIKNNPPPYLLIVGGDDNASNEIDRLHQITEQLNMRDRVHFAGSIDQEKLPLFYNAADVCVIPSYYESFGLVALESLACGTPIITTDVGDMKNIVISATAGRILKDNYPQSISDKISELLYKESNQTTDVNERRAIASRYSWSIITDMVIQEYDSISN